MPESASLVRAELDLFGRQADEAWKKPHAELMEIYKLKDECQEILVELFTLGTFVFQRIEALEKRWCALVHSGKNKHDEKFAKQIDEFYVVWHQYAKPGFHLILLFKGIGVQLDNAASFEDAYIRNPAASLSFDRVVAASKKAQEGFKGRSLREVADALHRKAVR